MKRIVLVLCLSLVILIGCSESQMKKTDALVQQGQAMGTAVVAVSPAIPPPFGEIIGGIAGLALILAGAYQTYRKGQVSAALDDLGVAAAGTTGKSVLESPLAVNINPSTATELKALGH